ncbi:hypothetical protein PENSPDRAFT_655944 [Peniophora sp. CONT]|nr:hypothetical protein PENSPDRAFT_655944 [Peniophora sp. CONT]
MVPDGFFENTPAGLWRRPIIGSLPDDPYKFVGGPPPLKQDQSWTGKQEKKPWTNTPAFCPALEGIDLPGAQWHRLTSVPAFTVCNKCHSTIIRASVTQTSMSFSAAFQPIPSSDIPSRPLCYFSTTHVRQLWDDVLRVRTLDGLIAYARMRTSLPACAGQQGCTPSSPLAPPVWYTLSPFRAPKVEGFIMCATCFHDEVAGSPAEACFVPHFGTQEPSEVWSCDASVPRVRGLLRELASKEVTWQTSEAFSTGVRQRLHECPPCPGIGVRVDPDSHAWFRAKSELKYPEPMQNMAICAACVLDCISTAPAAGRPGVSEDHFERREPAPKSEPGSDANWYTCDAAVPSFRFALTQDHNHPPPRVPGVCHIWGSGVDNTDAADIWRDAARRLFTAGGSCVEQPGNTIPDGAQAYRIRPSAYGEHVELDFDLCAACYMGIVRPLFHDRFVQTVARNKVCDLGHTRPEREEIVRALVGACAVRDFGVFERWLREKAQKSIENAGHSGSPALLVPRIEDFKTTLDG